MTKTFTCWKCEQTFPKEWTDEEAEQEYASIFGKHLGEHREVLCDDCHKQFMEWFTHRDQRKTDD